MLWIISNEVDSGAGKGQVGFEESEYFFFFFFLFTLVTGPRRSLSLKLSDTSVYEPQIRARLGTTWKGKVGFEESDYLGA